MITCRAAEGDIQALDNYEIINSLTWAKKKLFNSSSSSSSFVIDIFSVRYRDKELLP